MGILNKETGFAGGKDSRGELRERIIGFLETRFVDVEELWESLETKEKIQLYKDLLKYAVPSLSSAEYKTGHREVDELQLLISRLGSEESEIEKIPPLGESDCMPVQSDTNLSINQIKQ